MNFNKSKYMHNYTCMIVCPLRAALMKCGQPLCGSSQRHCREDITFFNSCLQCVEKGRIIDVRTQHKAQHHTSKG